MKTKTLKFCLCLFTVVAVFISCEPDDGPTVTFKEEDRTEQQAKDKDSLILYLSTHYYNSSFFESGSNHKYTDIIITKLADGEDVPADNTLLMEAVETRYTEYLEIDYEYYVLNINQGGGSAPEFTDQVRVRYEGYSVDNDSDDLNIFDSRITPIDFSLVGNGFTTFGTIRAWQLVMPSFSSSLDFTNGIDGIVNFNNFGLGVMFIPSGLAYFSGITTGSPYDNLVFKFELLQFEQSDHDTDGLPSYEEDLDGDLDVNNDDTDEDGFPNYIDLDDDGDGVSTLNELIPTEYIVDTNLGEEEPVLGLNEFERSRTLSNGIITIKTVTIADSNNDDVPDYLDENITINYNETSS